MLHATSCLLKLEFRERFHTTMIDNLGYILSCLRARQFTAIDVAHAAHVVGRWRGGPNTEHFGIDRINPVVQSLMNEIENAAIELLQVRTCSHRA